MKTGRVSLPVPRWIQLVALPLAAVAIWSIAAEVQQALLVFTVSSLAALLLNPLVHQLTRTGLPRGLSVLAVYLIGFALLISVIAVAGAVVVEQVGNAARAVETQFTAKTGTDRTPADDRIDELQRWLDDNGLGQVHIRPVGRKAIERVQKEGALGYARKAIDVGQTIATAIVTGIFALILILVVSIYMLLDAPRMSRYVNRLLPPGEDGRELGREVQRALVGYVRGQFLVSLIIGASAGIAMEVFGLAGIWPAARSYAIFLGLFAMVTESIPYIGPIVGAVPPIALALFDDPLTAVWVALAFLAIHQLEGHIVVPRVMGQALRSHPLMVIFGLLIGAELWGIVGAVLALPTLAVSRVVYDFLRARIVFEPWPVNVSSAFAGGGVEAATAPSDADSSVPRPPHDGQPHGSPRCAGHDEEVER